MASSCNFCKHKKRGEFEWKIGKMFLRTGANVYFVDEKKIVLMLVAASYILIAACLVIELSRLNSLIM